MISKDVLLNQKVIFRDDASPLMIVGVNEFNNIKDVKITLENNKTLVLFLAFSNGFLNFVDEKIQNQVAQEIETFNEKQKQDELKREETKKEAMQIAVKRANKINELKQVKKRNKSNPNVRKDKKNVAIKATYCDNGEEWFKGPCSVECRLRNCSKGGGRFCSTNSVCKRVIDGLATEKDVMDAFNKTFLCYESKMLIDYKVYAGRDDDGTVRGWSLDKDRLVILTTVKPGCLEEDRVIFGVFLINASFDKDVEEAYATSYPSCRLALNKDEAEQMKYWDYAPGEGPNNLIQWKEGLLRYQKDEMCATVLRDIVDIIAKRNNPSQTVYANAFLNLFLKKINKNIEDIPKKNGARLK